MLSELLLAFVQSATEFLPVSSSGHLALFSNVLSSPNIFFFTVLHLASLVAVLFFTRSEIRLLFRFDDSAMLMWKYLFIATLPAALVGYFFHDVISRMFSSYLFLGVAFFFTGTVLLLTRYTTVTSNFSSRNVLLIGLFQALALFPGISRSGMTISSSMFSGIPRERSVKFSFLLFIPLSVGAFILELGNAYFSYTLLFSFVVAVVFSLLFLHLLSLVVERKKFWLFSFYCYLMSLLSLFLMLFF